MHILMHYAEDIASLLMRPGDLLEFQLLSRLQRSVSSLGVCGIIP